MRERDAPPLTVRRFSQLFSRSLRFQGRQIPLILSASRIKEVEKIEYCANQARADIKPLKSLD